MESAVNILEIEATSAMEAGARLPQRLKKKAIANMIIIALTMEDTVTIVTMSRENICERIQMMCKIYNLIDVLLVVK